MTPRTPHAETQPRRDAAQALNPALRRRVIVENVQPRVDEGRFPIKRTVTEPVIVTADVFADGHDRLQAVVRYRPAAGEWQEAPMAPLGNDRWEGRFTVEELQAYEYTVEGWIDEYGSWLHGLVVKFEAGQQVDSELKEGAALLERAAQRAGSDAATLRSRARRIGDVSQPGLAVQAARDPELARLMTVHADRSRATSYDPPLRIHVDRERARFGSWYEFFPRSCGPDPARSGTLADAEKRLPEIADLGFDVVYLPPVHPIGTSHRKGKNNTLIAEPGDVGSPWAIGSPEGGHTAIEPGLGTLDDFDRFVAAAARHNLEVALDIAFQCSPDHPWVKEHPQWFRQRPDGTIKYAENPPKKYQDIYPINLDSDDWENLWAALRDVMLFWVGHGVKIFRVDNPHTKTLRFWGWAIAEIQRQHPEVLFLSEAFTRPRVMEYLAKAGFTQSYTYFTWRNTRAELTDYFTELTQTPVFEFLRPNLFANTPDILHEYLQHGGRPAFMIRLVLAGTLGATYGIYSSFEICENRPVRPGSEEYLDSEKYQIRHWDFDKPGHIKELVARINTLRRTHPALQYNSGLRFYGSDNPQILCYGKQSPDALSAVVMVVTVDPRHMQHGFVTLPLADFGLTPDATYEMVDLLNDARYTWRGARNYVRLDPGVAVAHIFQITGARPVAAHP